MKVLLGLSGGVDSAVAAYLLKEKGYDVTCCFMRNWDSLTNNDILGNPTLENDECSQETDYNDAKKVADQLGLKLLRVDFVKEYWDNVFSVFLKEYEAGRTPNPDILCNKYIKFDSFFKFAKDNGFDFLATGHYVKSETKDGKTIMKKAVDGNKDQSYFLCQISRESLEKSIFPLGEISKEEVRKIADDLNLAVAKKKDSTGICFIGERNFRQFLSNYLPMKSGNIIDVSTNKIKGIHKGVLYYTIGQRKGLDIGGEGGPWFVVGKDILKNELYVSSENENDLLISTSCIVNNVNWLYEIPDELECNAKFRYRQPDQKIILKKINDDLVECIYKQGIKAVTPGQEAVFYIDDIVIGGGVIDKVFKNGIDIFEQVKEKVNGKSN